MPLSQHINVFTSLEAPRVPSFTDFKLGFTLQAWLIKSLAIDKESESEVTQSCPTLCDPMDYSLSGSSVHGIFQARILEWVAISFSRRSSQPRDWTWVSCTVGRRFTIWATREAHWPLVTELKLQVPLIFPEVREVGLKVLILLPPGRFFSWWGSHLGVI